MPHMPMIRRILCLAPLLFPFVQAARGDFISDAGTSLAQLDGLTPRHLKRRRHHQYEPFARSALYRRDRFKLVTEIRGGNDDGGDIPEDLPMETTQSSPPSSTLDLTRLSAGMLPTVVTSIFLAYSGLRRESTDRLMQFPSIYAWTLIGSSVGFYLFLYFISVGYALGIGLPIAVTLFSYLRYRTASLSTLLHASLVVLWSLRLSTFLVWREYSSWPALHAKIVRVNDEQNISWYQKVVCWMAYSFLYVCMLTPCWFRLEEGPSMGGGLSPGTRLGIGLQTVGLALESVADYQKSIFKSRHRLEWCRSGLWQYSTHPNYAGEWLFWFGTWIAGGAARNWPEVIMSLVGLAFITAVLNGAAQALEMKQRTKYGAAYSNFCERTGMWGPKFWVPTTGVSINATATTLLTPDDNEIGVEDDVVVAAPL